ncbi:MAG: VWA domain-containing protein [Candidatus Methanoperedens sp.]|nr:VWA domain-containing protein [Candidatus Methanoperedens sp.]
MDIPQFANPFIILLISPLILGGWYAIRKGIPKLIIISRLIILSLLIIALAEPFTMSASSVRDEVPKVTIVSDQTMSMDLFNKDTGGKIFEAIKSKTPTTARQFAGIKSPIGDEVIQDAEGNNNIVLVSDGNNNYGKDLFDAISFVSKTGTRVFAVKQAPIHNDASVEIESAKNLIIGNENVFNIVVRQAGNETSYRLDVEIDGASVKLPDESKNVVQTERTKVIPVSATFNTLGTHKVTATITPNGEDWFKLNNVFYKSVFVVPKPKVLAVTADTGSPLYTVASSLYQVTTLNSVPDDLSPYKAVVIDNKGAGQLSADSLSKYVGSGGGLVVVGGDAAYDKGSYNNSPVEAILPIISRAAEFKGGENIIILMDTSGSTTGGTGPGVNEAFPDINANARKIVDTSDFGGHVGVIAFGGTIGAIEFTPITSASDKINLENQIEKFYPGGAQNPTNLDAAFAKALKILDSVSGEKAIIVISDGQVDKGVGIKQIKDLISQKVQMRFIQILSSYETNPKPNENYEELAINANTHVEVLNPGDRLKITKEEKPGATPTPTPTPGIEQFGIRVVNPDHFITKYINLTASITGYNPVTPKLGSDMLVAIATRGDPILTTWGFGLGRVASFTTDNGNPSGNTAWASAVYSGENSRLIASMINWAIGDPRPKEGVVIQAEDIWGGTPGRVVVTSNTLPQVKLDGAPLDLSRTGPTTYESSVNLEKEGFHDISGYGIAVNYPLEYRDVGFNDKLISVIESNGGRVYDEKDVEGLLLLDIKEKAVRTVEEPKSEKEPFLLAALGLFLTEIIVRRLKDYRKERPVIEENPPRTAPAVSVAEPVAAE